MSLNHSFSVEKVDSLHVVGRCCMHREPPDSRKLGRSLDHTGTSWILFPGSGVAEFWPSDGADETGPSGCSPRLVDVHGNPMGLALVQPSLGDLPVDHLSVFIHGFRLSRGALRGWRPTDHCPFTSGSALVRPESYISTISEVGGNWERSGWITAASQEPN